MGGEEKVTGGCRHHRVGGVRVAAGIGGGERKAMEPSGPKIRRQGVLASPRRFGKMCVMISLVQRVTRVWRRGEGTAC